MLRCSNHPFSPENGNAERHRFGQIAVSRFNNRFSGSIFVEQDFANSTFCLCRRREMREKVDKFESLVKLSNKFPMDINLGKSAYSSGHRRGKLTIRRSQARCFSPTGFNGEGVCEERRDTAKWYGNERLARSRQKETGVQRRAKATALRENNTRTIRNRKKLKQFAATLRNRRS